MTLTKTPKPSYLNFKIFSTSSIFILAYRYIKDLRDHWFDLSDSLERSSSSIWYNVENYIWISRICLWVSSISNHIVRCSSISSLLHPLGNSLSDLFVDILISVLHRQFLLTFRWSLIWVVFANANHTHDTLFEIHFASTNWPDA